MWLNKDNFIDIIVKIKHIKKLVNNIELSIFSCFAFISSGKNIKPKTTNKVIHNIYCRYQYSLDILVIKNIVIVNKNIINKNLTIINNLFSLFP